MIEARQRPPKRNAFRIEEKRASSSPPVKKYEHHEDDSFALRQQPDRRIRRTS